MLSRPWVFLPRSHPGNCALSQTQLSLSLSLSLSCRPSSGASQSWKYNCGEREKFKHLLLIFYQYFNIMPFSDGQHHFLLLLKTRFLPQTRPNVKTILSEHETLLFIRLRTGQTQPGLMAIFGRIRCEVMNLVKHQGFDFFRFINLKCFTYLSSSDSIQIRRGLRRSYLCIFYRSQAVNKYHKPAAALRTRWRLSRESSYENADFQTYCNQKRVVAVTLPTLLDLHKTQTIINNS